MFTFLTRTPVFFDAPAEAGGGAPVEPAEPVVTEPVVTTESTEASPAAEAGAETEPVVVTEPVDPFGEFGGRDQVSRAVELDRALQTREGVSALLEEAGKMLYGSDPAKAALLQQLLAQEAAQTGPDPLADILADPERLLTPAEVAQVVDVKVQQAIEKVLGEHVQPLEERQAAEAQASVERSVNTALAQLEVPEEATRAVLDYADKYVGGADINNPAKVTDAIRRGLADYQAEMEKRVAAYLTAKKTVAEEHPTTLKSGGAPGGEDAVEPANEDEAIAAVRQAFASRS